MHLLMRNKSFSRLVASLTIAISAALTIAVLAVNAHMSRMEEDYVHNL